LLSNMEKSSEFPLSIRLKKPFLCVEGRFVKFHVYIKNESSDVFPSDGRLLVTYGGTSIAGTGAGSTEAESERPHIHVGTLKPGEERKLSFKLRFLGSGVYELRLSVIVWDGERRDLAIKPKYRKEFFYRIRCSSWHEVLSIVGGIAATAAAIVSVVNFILLFLKG